MKTQYLQDRIKRHQLDFLNSDRKLNVLCTHLDELKIVQIAIARGDVPRVHQIFHRVLKEGRGTQALLTLMDQASSGGYSPKGFDQMDYDQGILTKQFGGPRLVYANQKCARIGGPSLTTIKNKSYSPKYSPLSSEIEEETIIGNYDRFLFSEEMTSVYARSKKFLHVLMIDDLKGEKRLHVEESSSKVIGLCYHAHKNSVSTELNCAEDCVSIRKALDAGEVHYATEITNVAIAPIREFEYRPIVVATSGGCLDQDPFERTLKLVEISIHTYVNSPD